MARDHRKLRVFQLADKLIMELYRSTARFPESERFGLQSQIRRAAVSIAVNIVEGCARRSEVEYGRYVDVAFASSRELQYLISIAARLAYFTTDAAHSAAERSDALCAQLMQLQRSVEVMIQQKRS